MSDAEGYPPVLRKTTTHILRLSRPIHDTPYRDESASHAAPSRGSSPRRQASSSSQQSARPTSHAAAAHSAPHKGASHSARRGAPRPAAAEALDRGVAPATPARRSSRRRRGKGAATGPRTPELTSHPTSRNAYMETRVWLLAEHGPVCAYCGRRFSAGVMTLDHVQPRRGQTAYDRRDNLVLACPGCNMIKRDMAPLAFLLGDRSRAAHLLRYGSHLSAGLVDLARSLVPGGVLPPMREKDSLEAFAEWAGLADDDGESPSSD